MTNANELDSWDDYISGNFLKAVNVENENDVFVCIDVNSIQVDDDSKVRLTLEKKEIEFLFDLNKTNAKKAKDLGIVSPKALIGKKIFFKKALVRDPKKNVEVEGLRIFKIE